VANGPNIFQMLLVDKLCCINSANSVFEANAIESNGESYTSQTLEPILMWFGIYYYVPMGVDMHNLV